MQITKEAKKDGQILWTAEVTTAEVRNLSDADIALVIGEALDQFSYRTGKASKKLKEMGDNDEIVGIETILEILREAGQRDSGPSKEDVADAVAFFKKCREDSKVFAPDDITKQRQFQRDRTARKDALMATAHTGGAFWNAGREWDSDTLAELFRHHRVSLDRDTRRRKAAMKALDGEDLSPPPTPEQKAAVANAAPDAE